MKDGNLKTQTVNLKTLGSVTTNETIKQTGIANTPTVEDKM